MSDTKPVQGGSVFVSEFSLEQLVWLRTDEDQKCRIVVGINFQANNSCQYQLSCGTSNSWHYACEISSERNALADIGLDSEKDANK